MTWASPEQSSVIGNPVCLVYSAILSFRRLRYSGEPGFSPGTVSSIPNLACSAPITFPFSFRIGDPLSPMQTIPTGDRLPAQMNCSQSGCFYYLVLLDTRATRLLLGKTVSHRHKNQFAGHFRRFAAGLECARELALSTAGQRARAFDCKQIRWAGSRILAHEK